jgi:hypothetical protein
LESMGGKEPVACVGAAKPPPPPPFPSLTFRTPPLLSPTSPCHAMPCLPAQRLVTFVEASAPDALHLGVHVPGADLTSGEIVDLTASLPGCPATMRGFLEGGAALLAAAAAVVAGDAARRVPFADVTLKVCGCVVCGFVVCSVWCVVCGV